MRRPWRIEAVTPERGDATTLTLAPVGHPGIRFAPGQFGWLTVDRSPFAITAHPFSFSSSAEDHDGVAITIKALGDFTATVGDIAPGTRAYLDGPHGVFTPDRNEGPGFVLIAGGVGITPMVSILRTMADRGDRRPFLLLYAVRTVAEQTFDAEIDALSRRLDLTVVLVPQDPAARMAGRVGVRRRRAAAAAPARPARAPAVLHLRPGADGDRRRGRPRRPGRPGRTRAHRTLHLRLTREAPSCATPTPHAPCG
ncbi:phenol hydroxylase [Nocardia farcinica]|nr:phenol hydroxylase [Nocardia farcinica]